MSANGTSVKPDRRLPPQDLEAEESLLGAMLLTKDAIAAAGEIVAGHDFYKDAHRYVFEAIRALHTRSEPADRLTVTDQLRRSGHHDLVGGEAALIRFQAATPATGNAARYATTVAEMAVLRRMTAIGSEITELGYSTPEDVAAAVDRAEQLIYNLGRPGTASATRTLPDVIRSVLEQLVDRADHGEEIDGIPTGWTDLDALLLGLSPGDLTIVGARPAQGKSQFAAVLAWQVATAGYPVLFASLEMKAEELGKRWLGTVARVRLQHIRRARLEDYEWDQLNASIATFQDVPVHVLDNFGANVAAIAAAGRRIGMAGGLVIVDYAQLVASSGRPNDSRNDQVAEVSRALKLMAGALGCHVLALSQLSRNLEQRGDKRPMLSDLRDSGALEQDPSNVLFLYRDEVYKGERSKERGVLEVICAKQRNGPQGTVRLSYQPAWGRIQDIAFRTPPDQGDT